jgi:sporulation protein YlmC with PRC-barrel domain
MNAMLVRLTDTDLTPAHSGDDVRGKTVVDRSDNEIGEVDDLVIDAEKRRVRLLQVGSGGFLGIGKQKVLVPVDAVTAVDDVVHVDTDREHVASGPVYDPDLVLQQDTVAGLYDYYGMLPYWSAGYRTPGFPFR